MCATGVLPVQDSGDAGDFVVGRWDDYGTTWRYVLTCLAGGGLWKHP
jgi:hypothetical protein